MIWLALKRKTIFIREPLESTSNKNDSGDWETLCAKAMLSCVNLMKFNKPNYKVQHLGRGNPKHK